MTAEASKARASVINHQRRQMGGRIVKETAAGASLTTPLVLMARTRKR